MFKQHFRQDLRSKRFVMDLLCLRRQRWRR
jgi:hypothetical protein